jgi:CspA family cold shock protein
LAYEIERREAPVLNRRGFSKMTGTIKKIMRQKGYGFITPDDGSEDVFFHRGSLAPRTQIEDFNEGDTVQFQSRKGEKGPVAFDMKVR